MGWKGLTFLIYTIVCVALSVALAVWTFRLLVIDPDTALAVPLFILLTGIYGGLLIGVAYERFKVALVQEKMEILLQRAATSIEGANVRKADRILAKLRLLGTECEPVYADEIEALESRLTSLKKSKS
jgi:hypothetical protein